MQRVYRWGCGVELSGHLHEIFALLRHAVETISFRLDGLVLGTKQWIPWCLYQHFKTEAAKQEKPWTER